MHKITPKFRETKEDFLIRSISELKKDNSDLTNEQLKEECNDSWNRRFENAKRDEDGKVIVGENVKFIFTSTIGPVE